MATAFGNAKKPLYYFLMDEPDAHDGEIDDLRNAKLPELGGLGQGLVERAEGFRARDASVPLLLNIDNTYTPENYYMYNQIADVPALDPYYIGELDIVYNRLPTRMQINSKPTYVYATTRMAQSAGAPKPLHVILCSTRYSDSKTGYVGRFPTPEEKRIEVYYALAAGAKGISYWWFSLDKECYGCGAPDPEAKALWKEIGLLGAEVRTAGPIVTMGCPVDVPVKAPRNLMTRCLISGLDTLALIAVNDNVLCDRVGTVVKPEPNCKVTVQAPSWMKPSDVFEISYQGVKTVSWTQDGSSVTVELGTVNVSRLVIITADTGLRKRLQDTYEKTFAANVGKLKAAAR
jgi:hypothetical protein